MCTGRVVSPGLVQKKPGTPACRNGMSLPLMRGTLGCVRIVIGISGMHPWPLEGFFRRGSISGVQVNPPLIGAASPQTLRRFYQVPLCGSSRRLSSKQSCSSPSTDKPHGPLRFAPALQSIRAASNVTQVPTPLSCAPCDPGPSSYPDAADNDNFIRCPSPGISQSHLFLRAL